MAACTLRHGTTSTDPLSPRGVHPRPRRLSLTADPLEDPGGAAHIGSAVGSTAGMTTATVVPSDVVAATASSST